MTPQVQDRIDRLGNQLQRSVVLNDPNVRLLYASQHYGDEDPARIKAALHRDAGSQLIAFVLSQGVNGWTSPGWIPAAPEIGLIAARLFVPVRWHGELLGAVVVIDADKTLTDLEVALVESFAREIAGLIASERHATDQQVLADEESVTAWLSTQPDARDRGLTSLRHRGLVPKIDRAQVLSVEMAAGDTGDSRVDPAFRHALAVVSKRRRDTTLTAVRHGRGAVALLYPGTLDAPVIHGFAQTIIAEASDFLGEENAVLVGIGGEIEGLDDAWLSRRRADLAVRAARVLRETAIVHWDSLGLYQLLLRIPASELDVTAVPEPLAALLEADAHGRLVETLEAYLRSGGAGAASAEKLHIHRTTLYYRLNQIRAITGLDVDDGEARAELQLGLATYRIITSLNDR